jgi:predicted nucleic acid-binding protein
LAIYFFDSSALVKRYVVEPGTAWVQATADPSIGHTIFIAQITRVEVVSGIKGKERNSQALVSAAASARAITDFLNDYLNQYEPIEVTDGIISEAVILVQRYLLSAADAIQLAVAKQIFNQLQILVPPSPLAPPLTFVCCDQRLNFAAAQEGFPIFNP